VIRPLPGGGRFLTRGHIVGILNRDTETTKRRATSTPASAVTKSGQTPGSCLLNLLEAPSDSQAGPVDLRWV
jgi:hypothetical protein